ncbi:FAD/NAD(P)-binding oxidoreductase [Citricoccus zhacaiensis]|uniref:FAD/NAD(P)-binding oxidoreductase n=1 Tax=Citricoccus zhacaiensis TaxID=489142 RepID=A0ABQ2M1W7_9MICC|nr:FAD-dependent oxidoreductase [Citricoccus zhacaiensis]GGO45878.1 FAD/NAD(P)-binding oxidoreductase [Citricoccus zhacaiensis]
MSGPLRIVVVGGGPVAARLIQELRPALEAGAAHVTVLGEEPVPAYQRIRLGDVASGRVDGAALALLDVQDEELAGVVVRCGVRVVALDRDRKTVLLDRTSGTPGPSVPYDRLVLATGAHAVIPDFPVSGTVGRGISVPAHGDGDHPVGVMALRDLGEARRLHQAVRDAEPVVVLGGGVLGVEAALALAEVGAAVTLLHRGHVPLGGQLDPDSGRLLLRQLLAAGIQVRPDCGVQELVVAARAQDRATVHDGVPHLTAIRTTQGRRIPAALLVACTGVRPRDELAAAAGLDTLPRGGIVVDRNGRCPDDPSVFAVGDCAAVLGSRPSGLIGPGWDQARAAAGAFLAEAGVPAAVERDAAGRPVLTPTPTPTPAPTGRLDPIVVKSHTLSVACAGDLTADPWDPQGPSVSTWADPEAGQYLRIVTQGTRLLGFVSIGLPRSAAELSRHALTGTLPVADRSALLAMEHAAADRELGPEDVLCRCSGATAGQVHEAAVECATVDEVGGRCGAGTGCGTCRGRIEELLAGPPVRQPAGSLA